MSEINKNNIDTLLKYYEAARQEILSRISSRDNTLLIYLGGIGAIISASIQSNNSNFLLIMPLIALGISPIVAHHHAMIGALSLYCSTELDPYFTKLGVEIPSWDNSRARMDFVKNTIRLRYFGDIALICIPALIGLFINLKGVNDFWSIGSFVVGLIFIIISFIIMIKSFRYRQVLFKKMQNIAETQSK